ncbi:hypothetical protein NUACC21_30330 [Scytonema sp. NUACC21]
MQAFWQPLGLDEFDNQDAILVGHDDSVNKVKKFKVWENPDKQERLKSMLAELSALLSNCK